MSETRDRRHTSRQFAGVTGVVTIGDEPLPCRVIDVSETGAQVRIDGRRASRNFVGKRVSLVRQDGSKRIGPVEGRVVWARPAVTGVYLGLELARREPEPRAAES
jgi:hypothetical protein